VFQLTFSPQLPRGLIVGRSRSGVKFSAVLLFNRFCGHCFAYPVAHNGLVLDGSRSYTDAAAGKIAR